MSEGGEPQKQRKFDQVDDAERLTLLREGAKSFASATIWTRKQESQFSTSLGILSETDGCLYVALPKDFDQRQFVDDLVKSGTRDAFFSVSLAKANIFFKATFIGFDGGMKFKAPTDVFKVQRRSHLRLAIPEGYKMKVEFTDPLFPDQKLIKNAIDISAGGLAVVVTRDEAAVFQNGLVLADLTFTLAMKEIKATAEVRHASPYKVNNIHVGTKVGLLFQQISADDAKHIGDYVLTETRKSFQSMVD